MIDPQLVTAVAALLTAIATLIKVLQHDGIIKTTARQVNGSSSALQQVATTASTTLEDLNAHLAALAAAAQTFSDVATSRNEPRPPAA